MSIKKLNPIGGEYTIYPSISDKGMSMALLPMLLRSQQRLKRSNINLDLKGVIIPLEMSLTEYEDRKKKHEKE